MSVLFLMQSGCTSLVRSIADAGWRQFLGFLSYKAKETGKVVIEVNRWFASSKICSCCGYTHEMTLSDRFLRCHCGNVIDRDMNAAINIKNELIKKFKVVETTFAKPVELP